MTDPSLRDVILLCLRESEREHEREREADVADASGASIEDLAAAIGREATVVDRFSLASMLSELRRDGLVADSGSGVVADDGTDDGVSDSYVLTDDGLERAEAWEERLADERVVVDDGDDRQELEFGSIPEVYDRSLASALSLRAPDGVVYLEPDRQPGFVDRDGERRRLRRLFENAADGGGLETALVVGDAGVGKTTLVEAVLEATTDRDWDRNRGAVTAIGRCRRNGGAPYHPFREAVDAIRGGGDDGIGGEGEADGDSDSDSDGEASDPFAAAAPPSASPDETSYRARLTMFHDRIVDWLAERATDGPLVVTIEDLEWADTATLELLEHLLEAEVDAPTVLIGTCRATAFDGSGNENANEIEPGADNGADTETDDENGAGADRETDTGRSLLDACLTSDAWSLRLELEPFGRESVAELIERRVGRRGVPPDFVDAVAEQTGGNPLYVVEIVAELVAEGAIEPTRDRYPDRPDDVIVTDAIETTVESRLSRLDADARAVLEAGAVVDGVVSLDLVRTVTGRDREGTTLEEAVDSLVEARLWERADGEAVQFSSEAVRSVVREMIDDDRGARLHRRIAEAMAGAGADGDRDRYAASAIAHHFERGGVPDRALEHWIAAGDDAASVYAHEDAVEWYERALRLARDRDHGRDRDQEGDETVLELLEALGDGYATRGEYEAADKHFRYVRERSDEPERIRRTYRYQARIRLERGEFEQTAEFAAAGLDVGGDAESGEAVTRETCWLHDYHANAAMKRGDLEAAIEEFSLQRRQADELGDDLLLGRAHNNLGICATIGGDSERGIERLERAASLIESVGDEGELANCLNNLAIAYHDANRFRRAQESFQRALELARKTGRPKTVALAANNLSVTARLQGRWEAARAYAEEADETGSRIRSDEMTAVAASNLAVIEAETGDLEAAIETIGRSIAITSRIGSPTQLARDRWFLARFLLRAGDLERAAEEIDASLELATEYGLADQRSLTLRARGRLRRERGEYESAIEDHRTGLECAREVGSDVAVARNRIGFAATLSRAEEIERALEESRAAREAVPSGFRLLDLKAAAVRGGVLRRAGEHEHEAARELLTDTLAGAREVSTVATLRCLYELGALALETGDQAAARERLSEGRELAAETGDALYRERFDALLETNGRPVRGESGSLDEERVAERND